MRHSKEHYNDYMSESRMDARYTGVPICGVPEYVAIPDKRSVINKGKTDTGILNEVFRDRLDTVRLTLFDILYELNNRSNLDIRLSKNINEDICNLRAQLLALESWPIGGNQSVDRRRVALEDKIHELERDLRNHDIKRWQDMVALKKELRNTFREYKDLKRKMRIIEHGIKR